MLPEPDDSGFTVPGAPPPVDAAFVSVPGFFAPVHLIAVVGDDFPQAERDYLASRGIDLSGLETRPGKTFRWTGRYHEDLNVRDTLRLDLNVFAEFQPRVGAATRKLPYVYLGNIAPALQAGVLDQFDIDATFVVWILAGFQHPRIYLLDGGYAKWQLEGKKLTQEYPHAEASGKALDAHHFKVPTAMLSDVQQTLGKPGVRLVDTRPADQYGGSAGAQRRRGHIPGAINHPWKDDLEQRDLSLVWKSVDSLRADYAARGITPDQDLILYCNSSTEASHVFFALKYLLGYPKVRIYTGAWSEWAERMELPIE